MKFRIISVLISFSFFVLAAPDAFGSPIKVGSKCNPLGLTKIFNGKKYTCVKSGKGLVWNKGVAIKVKVPLPSPSPTGTKVATGGNTPSPVATVTNSDSDNNLKFLQAYRKIQSVNSFSTPSKLDLLLISHESINTDSISLIRNRYQKSVDFWGVDLLEPRFKVIISANDQIPWMRDELRKILPGNWDEWYSWVSKYMPERQCLDNNAGSYGKWNDYYVQSYLLFSKICSSQIPDNYIFQNIVEHEMVHSMQSSLTKNNNRLLPCWFNEGQASYYGFSLAHISDQNKFLKSRQENLDRWRYQSRDFAEKIREMNEKIPAMECGNNGAYAYGFIAVEQLLMEYEHLEIQNFIKETSVSKDWNGAFIKIFGNTFNEWLSKVSKNL